MQIDYIKYLLNIYLLLNMHLIMVSENTSTHSDKYLSMPNEILWYLEDSRNDLQYVPWKAGILVIVNIQMVNITDATKVHSTDGRKYFIFGVQEN